MEKLETADTAMVGPAAKKMKLDDEPKEDNVEVNTSLIQVKAAKSEVHHRIYS